MSDKLEPPQADLDTPCSIVKDDKPGDRGAVTIAAMFKGGRMIALEFNAN